MWLLTTALAAPTVGLGASVATHPNTPHARGAVLPSALVEVRASSTFAVQVEGGVGLHVFAERSWNTEWITAQNTVLPEISERRAFGTVMAVFSPLQGELSVPASLPLAIDLGAGFGAVFTTDDLEALQAESDVVAQATERQVHPSLNWMVGPRLGLGRGWSASARVKGAHWVETLEGINLVRRAQVDGGLAFVHTF